MLSPTVHLVIDNRQQKQKEGEQISHRRRQWHEDGEGHHLPTSDDLAEAARKRMADDRKKEYQELLEKVQPLDVVF
jgi:hypothetical protein